MKSSYSLSPEDRAFIDRIRTAPYLSRDEEQTLARAWRDRQDKGARDRLATAHMRVVLSHARPYLRFGHALPDLIGEGSVGLMKAIDRFEPDYGFRLVTYAQAQIEESLRSFVHGHHSGIRTISGARQSRLFFKLNHVKAAMGLLDDRPMSVLQAQAVARRLDAPVADVVRMEQHLAGTVSLNAPLNGGEDAAQIQDRIADGAPDIADDVAMRQEQAMHRQMLAAAMDTLKPRERYIVKKLYLDDPAQTRVTLSVQHEISVARVRQIEIRAVEKLKIAARQMMGAPVPSRGAPSSSAPLASPKL